MCLVASWPSAGLSSHVRTERAVYMYVLFFRAFFSRVACASEGLPSAPIGIIYKCTPGASSLPFFCSFVVLGCLPHCTVPFSFVSYPDRIRKTTIISITSLAPSPPVYDVYVPLRARLFYCSFESGLRPRRASVRGGRLRVPPVRRHQHHPGPPDPPGVL